MKSNRSNTNTHKIALLLIFAATATAAAGFGYFGDNPVSRIFAGTQASAASPTTFQVAASRTAPVNVETPRSPWIKLREGVATASEFTGSETAIARFRAGDLAPTTLVSADVNADGFPDLISGFSSNGVGVITIHHGSRQAFSPDDPAVLAGISKGQFPASFESQARAFDVPASPDYIFTGRFLMGSDLDIAVATRGSNVIYIYSISRKGVIADPVTVDLGGPLTAIAADTLDPAKGYTGIVAATSDTSLVVFDGSLPITDTKPHVTALDRRVDSLIVISPDGLTTAKDLFLLGAGRISRIAAIGKGASEDTNINVPFTAVDFAAGEFIRDRRARTELAVLADNGSIYYLANGSLDRRPFTETEMRASFAKYGRGRKVVVNSTDTASALANEWSVAEQQDLGLVNLVKNGTAPLLRRAYVTGNETDDLLVTDPSSNSLKVLFKEPVYGTDRQAFTGETQVENLAFGSNINAALPVRLNVMGQQGIAVLETGKLEATPVLFIPSATFTVTKTADTNDGVCNADCSVREAVVAANTAAGADLISVPAGTYQITIAGVENTAASGDLDILQSTTITGAGSGFTSLTAGASAASAIDKVLSINPTFTSAFATSITGVTVRFGKNPSTYAVDGFAGGFDWEGSGTGTLVVTGSTIRDNLTTDGDGGGIAATNSSAGSGSFTMSTSTVQNNAPARTGVSSPVGGGIFVGTTTPYLFTGSTIINNNVNGSGGQGQGAGIFAFGPSGSGGNSFVTSSIVSGNAAPSDGGGIYTTQRVDINSGDDINSNSSGRFGGGLFVNHNAATSTISKSNFRVNFAASTGGAIYLGTTTTANVLNMSYSRVIANTSTSGLTGLATAGGTANAALNWWGCNTTSVSAPCDTTGTAGGGTIGVTPWLQLRLTAATSPVLVGQTSSLTSSVLLDSSGGAVSTSNLDVLINRTVTWGSTFGSISGSQTFIQANGQATATYTGTAIGAGTATATIDSGTATANITVNKSDTTTALVSGTNPSVFGQSVTFTATVNVTAPGSGTPTGTITFKDNAVNIGTCLAQAVSSSAATCSISTLSVASHPITAVYNGDANFNASPTSNTVTQVVNQAATTTALVSGTNPSINGQSVTFTATISVTAPGAGTPTGTVAFKDNGVNIGTCAAQAVSASTATCTVSNLSIATHPITAVYSGDTNFTTSTSNTVSQVVNKASTTVALVSGTNPSVFGQSVTLTATISITAPGTGTPTGTITFLDNAVNIGSCAAQAVSAAAATCTISTLGVASHPLTAIYNGDANFNASPASNTVTQVVNKASTTVALVSGANSSVFGQSVTFTATISVTAPGAGTPTGTVTFKDGAVNIGTCAAQTVSASVASCTISTLSVATHPITAVYNGDTNFNASAASNSVSQVINKADTTIALVSGANSSVFGQSVTFTATISVTAPGAGTPTGTVTFKDGAVNIGTCAAQTVSASAASCTISTLSVATHPITAVYNGDTNFNASAASNAVSQVVNKASTTTALVSGTNPSVFGQSVTFTATISVTGPGSGTPTGTVSFFDNAVSIGICSAQAVSASSATCSVSSLSVATHPITAVYNGDASFNASAASNTVSQVVNKSATSVALVSGTNPSTSGQSVTFTATISVTAPGVGEPTGTVTFQDNAVTIGTCSAQATTALAATCTISTLSVATHPITAIYNGDANFASSTSNTVSQVVNGTPPDLTITKTNNGPWIQGGTGTFVLTVNNIGGTASTGAITVTDPMPTGLTLASTSSSVAWNCAASTVANVSCTSSTPIAAAGNGGAITVNVNVAANAAASILNTATVAGGGQTNTANDTGSTTVTVNPGDTTLPTAAATLTNVTGPGGTLYTFTVSYADNVAINVATLDNNDIVVTGPNAFSSPATFVSVDVNSNGTPRVATYSIVPPGGTWDAADNGTYTVSMQASQVADTTGNFVNAGSLGTFTAVPLALVVDRTDDTVVSTCSAAANDCTLRGAIAAANAAPTGDTITFDPVVFATPQTITLGGTEIVIANSGGLTITGPGADKLTVSGNAASRIFSNSPNAVTTISGMRLTGGTGVGATGTGRGGAVYNTGGTLTLNNLVLTGNTSTNGAALSNATAPATLNVNNCWVTANATPGSGGALQNFAGTTIITNITNSSFTGNVSNSTSVGGGAIQANGVVNITNSTIGGNTATGGSGAIFYNGNALTVTNSTIAGNTSTNNGGGIHSTSATPAIIRNSIIAGNNGAVASPDMAGIANSLGNNIVGTVGTSTGWVGSDLQNVNPLLAPLGYYGGNGYSFALTSASPALNAGQPCVTNLTCATNNPPVALTADQRGAARIGVVDIGAFELNNSANGGTFVAQLPNALQGTAYNFLLVPVNTGASQAVTSGSLPSAIVLNSGATASLTGTPTISGLFPFSMTTTVGANSNVTDYGLLVFAPPGTLVSVGGRVMTVAGAPVSGAMVILTDSGNVQRTATTSPLGYYLIQNVPAGATYTVSQASKRYIFTPFNLNVGSNLSNVDLAFTPKP